MNLVVLQGNLTRKPDYKNIGQTTVTNFGLAINRKTKNGEETVFVEVSAFGRTADNIAKYFDKGKMILIQGRLHLDSWVDSTTQKQVTKLKVIAERFNFCGSNQSGGQSQGQYQGQQQQASQNNYGPQQGQPQNGYVAPGAPTNQAPTSPFV